MGYSPILGRFLQRDPIGFISPGNLYQYVAGSPPNFLDPSGLDPVQHRTIDDSGYWNDGPFLYVYPPAPPVLDSASDGFMHGYFGGGQNAQFGPLATNFIADNLDLSGLFKSALGGTECQQGQQSYTVNLIKGFNPKVGTGVVPASDPLDLTDLVGRSVGVSYNSKCSVIVSAVNSNGCCTASIYCDVEADVRETYTFKSKGLGLGQTPYMIFGHISTFRRQERLLCECQSSTNIGMSNSQGPSQPGESDGKMPLNYSGPALPW